MAIPVSIEQLVNGKTVESNRIEFKEGYNPEEILHSICAFANDIDNIGGGYIVIGAAAEDGVPVFPLTGIPKNQIDKIQRKLIELCHYIEPYYAPVEEPVLYHDAWLIILWCPGGFGRPYKAAKDPFQKHPVKYYYIRKFSSSVRASAEEEKELFYISSSIPFDDRPNLSASVDDLDMSLMREHLKEINSSLYARSKDMSLQELAGSLQLLDGPPENIHPRNVGILMFSSRTQDYFRYARIEIVDIPDPSGKNMTEKVFTGPIQYQLRDALLYIKNYILQEKVIKRSDSAESERVWNYPYDAVREILANAVYHRSYQIAEPISVRVTPAQMEITSFPGFDRTITEQDIASGNIKGKIYRNRRIGDFLKELSLIEGRNTGFPNAAEALENNGSKPLKFDMDIDRQYLSVIIPVHPAFFTQKQSKEEAYEQKILDILEKEPLTLTEISSLMGYKGITKKLRDTVQALVKQNKINILYDESRKVLYAVDPFFKNL